MRKSGSGAKVPKSSSGFGASIQAISTKTHWLKCGLRATAHRKSIATTIIRENIKASGTVATINYVSDF